MNRPAHLHAHATRDARSRPWLRALAMGGSGIAGVDRALSRFAK
jgi:hypothetical protein